MTVTVRSPLKTRTMIGSTSKVLLVVATWGVLACGEGSVPHRKTYELGRTLPIALAHGDSSWIGNASGISIRGPWIAIADPVRSMVHLLDRSNGSWRSLGGEGRGPGEYTGFLAAVFVGDELWVGNMGNSRLDRYAPDGKLLASIRTEIPLSFAADDHGNAVVRAVDFEHLLQVTTEDSTWLVGDLDSLPAPLGEASRSAYMQPNFVELAPVENGRFVIAENDRGTLWAASLSGTELELTEIALSPDLRQQLMDGTAQMEALFPGPGGWSPAFDKPHVAPDGTIWIRTVPLGGDVLALLVDFSERSVHGVFVRSKHEGLRSLKATALKGDTLFYAGDTKIGAYLLRPAD